MILCRSLFDPDSVRQFDGEVCPAGYGPAVGFKAPDVEFVQVSLALVFFSMLIIKRAIDGWS